MIKEMDENNIVYGVAIARESEWGGAAKNSDLPGQPQINHWIHKFTLLFNKCPIVWNRGLQQWQQILTRVFIFMSWVAFLPGVDLADKQTVSSVNFTMVFLIAATVTIGNVSSYLNIGNAIINAIIPYNINEIIVFTVKNLMVSFMLIIPKLNISRALVISYGKNNCPLLCHIICTSPGKDFWQFPQENNQRSQLWWCGSKEG